MIRRNYVAYDSPPPDVRPVGKVPTLHTPLGVSGSGVGGLDEFREAEVGDLCDGQVLGEEDVGRRDGGWE